MNRIIEHEAVCDNCGRVQLVRTRLRGIVHVASCDYCRDGFVRQVKEVFQ